MYKPIFILVLAIVCYSCQETSDPSTTVAYEKTTPANTAANLDTIRALYRNIIDACNTVDADRLIGYYSRSDQMAFIDPNGNIHTEYDSLHNMMKQVYNSIQSQTLNLKDIDIQMLSDNYAVGVTNGEFTTITKAGKTLYATLGWTLFFSREPDGWKLLKAHQSSKMKG